MSNPGLFKDLGKRVNDLLTKEFPSDEKKVEWKGVTNNNVTVESSFTQKGDGAIVGTITPSYKYKPYGMNFLAEINTKREVKLETSVENQLVDGLKLTATGESRGENTFATVSAEYRHEYATATISMDYGKAAGSLVKASTVVGSQGVALGLSAEYFLGNTDHSELKTLNTTLLYATKDFDAALFGRVLTEKDKNEIGASYFHNFNPNVAFGTEVVFDTTHTDAKPKLSFGSQCRINDETVVKGKFDTNGILGLSYAQRFNKNSRLIIGANVDTANLSGKSTSVFGFTLSLSS